MNQAGESDAHVKAEQAQFADLDGKADGGRTPARPLAGDGGPAAPDLVANRVDAALVDAPADAEAADSVLRNISTTLTRMDSRLSQIEAQLQGAAPTPQPLPSQLIVANPLSAGWSRFQLAALATAAIVLFLRLYSLDQLQNEIYGDIALIFDYIGEIRAPTWPTHFTLSSGPLYHYLIMPVIALTGPTYFGIKLASALVSLGVLVATFAFARRLVDERFGLLAMLIAGVSSWLLIFSRLGNSQILVPLLTACALWLMLRVIQGGRTVDVVACAAVSALGLYAYPQSFILPFVIGLTLLCLRWAGLPVRWDDLWRFALVTALCALPFAWIVSRDPDNFFSGYIGGKLGDGGNLAGTLVGNIWRGLLALHVQGDGAYRSNPPWQPHLDQVSGLLFLVGLVFWLRPERRRLSLALLVPLVLLQVPSWLVLREPDEVPSASRALGAVPVIYILVASGLWWIVRIIQARRRGWPAAVVAAALLVAILLLNAQRYFRDYIGGLPYQNTPIARLVATYVDSLPPETKVYLIGCCWQNAMPEPNGIKYAIARPEQLDVKQPESLNCDWLELTQQPAVLIWSFQSVLPSTQIEACRGMLPAQLYASRQGLPVFYAAPLLKGQAASAAPAPAPASGGEQLELSMVEIDAQTARVSYSSLDIGEVRNVFDRQADSLIRGKDANPLVLDIQFSQPRSVSAISMTLATMPHAQIKIELTREDGGTTSFSREFIDLDGIPDVELPVPSAPVRTRRLRIEILDLAPRGQDAPHIHVREVQLR
jgi:4-amino-4-deoxy-L-arabinose transferase-like glycosyltransferase